MDRQKQPKVSHASAPAQPWWTFPISIHHEADGAHVHVAWRRLGLLLLLSAIFAWFAMAGGIYLWLKYYRGFTDVRIGYICFPNRWPEYSAARGNFYIKQAKQEIAAQKWAEAIHHLRVGVAAAPSNTEGRLLLAQFFTLVNRIELAQRTLVEGLPYAKDNNDYLKTLFGFLLQYQEDNEIRRIATELLPASPHIDSRNQLIAIAAATANLYRGNYDAAEALIKDYELLHTKDGRILLARIEWECGHRDSALDRLKGYTREFPGDEEFYSQLVAFYRELGQYAEVEQYALMRELINPNSAAARIDLLQDYKLNHNTEQFQHSVDTIVRDFADDRNALNLLANFGTEHGDAALALRVYRHMQQRNLETDSTGLIVTEAYIVAGEYRAALDFVGELGRAHPKWLQKYNSIIYGLQAIASYGLGQHEEGDLYLGHFLKQPDLRTANLTAIANRLIAIGAKAQARRVLAQAVASDLRNQAALTLLVELDLERTPTDELSANIRRLLTMRRPSPKVLSNARVRLSSDRFLFVSGRDDLLAAIQTALDHSPVPIGQSS